MNKKINGKRKLQKIRPKLKLLNKNKKDLKQLTHKFQKKNDYLVPLFKNLHYKSIICLLNNIILMQVQKRIILSMLIISSLLFSLSFCIKQNLLANQIVVEKGTNITSQMQAGIRKSIKDSSLNCTIADRSCFSQIIGMKIQALYGKSWNVHLFQKTTTIIKGQQYSHDRWISLVNEGDPAFSYFIFKPIDCSKPFRPVKIELNEEKFDRQQKQYWGSSMTDSLKNKIKTIIEDAYKNSSMIDKNSEYIQNKLGPGRWQVIIWNTPSFDYFDTCMYASYFGMLIGIQRGNSQWSYYVGRMSLI